MEPKELCEKFIEADKIINDGYYDIMTMDDKTKYPNFNKYYSNSKRETGVQLDSLSEDLFNQLGKEIKDEYYEYFMMWLSDKLFEIAKEDDKSQINDITLNDAYENYLKNNIGDFNYWILLDNKEGLKEVNLMYMKQFYKLLNDICKAIVYYKQNDDDIEKLINYSIDCSNQYMSLYENIYKCKSYLRLLDNLKNTYYSFINDVINKDEKNEELAWKLKTLKTSDETDDYFAKDFKEFDFNCSECKPQKTQTDEPNHKKGSEDFKSGQTSLNSENGSSEGGPGVGSSGSGSGGSEGPGGVPGSGASGGSKTLVDQVPIHPSEKSNGGWLGNLGMGFNLTDYMLSFSDIYDSSKNILTNTANQITSAYNSAKAIAHDTYYKTVSIAKDTYSATTNYIGGAVNSITNQFNSFVTFQLSYGQSGSNSLGSGVDTSNHSQQNPSQTSPPSPSSSIPQSLPSPPSPLSPVTSSDPQTPSPKSLDPQSTSTQNFKSSDQQSASNAGNRASQIPSSGQVTLLSSGICPSNIGSGNNPSGTDVKMNKKSSIWCIGLNKKYDILGIGIISISIFAFLAIMYKYLSLGCTSKSKRKKSVKKVINSIGGKRPIQIIIKSYDRNKDLKPIINSVGRKKDPLLNIYKLMQADPIPFINLFFLLIFFVYKRKYDFLEL
ncbi:CIR protein PIR protein [Plasmodium vinckei brucechwatti]|uniref:CIR protein PIR protein n=1 Tax=Plasmodium vinckei brucechwatti TaxID=119398 RepID=A0A6V7RU58_PLAVN|nr:CIR protein PIR protein [Plasmodium vinckei brucechwatti]